MYNRMTDVVNKIERRLGTAPLGLPDHLAKDKWADAVIIPDTITTFSRYFPYMIKIMLTPEDRKGDYYLLDRHIPEGMEVLGVKDIIWDDINTQCSGIQQFSGYGIYNSLNRNMDMKTIMLSQQYADISSLFNTGIYTTWIPPNKVRLDMAAGGSIQDLMNYVSMGIFVKHPPNLMTIEPTKMETFEKLALADVALWLFETLKHYDGIETVFANIDLKLSSLESKAQTRDDIVRFLEENYVNPANSNQPIMYVV